MRLKSLKKKALTKAVQFGEFVDWMATPELLREIKTQQEFSKRFNVSQQTLSDWKQRVDFWAGVEKDFSNKVTQTTSPLTYY